MIYSQEIFMKLSGNCLCGKLSFEATSKSGNIYQCHCSKCRRSTGSSANANVIVKIHEFKWLVAPTSLKQFVSNGWVSSFCSECGCKAPITDTKNGICYIPAGTLNQDHDLKVTSHIYVGSKAFWDVIGGSATQLKER